MKIFTSKHKLFLESLLSEIPMLWIAVRRLEEKIDKLDSSTIFESKYSPKKSIFQMGDHENVVLTEIENKMIRDSDELLINGTVYIKKDIEEKND